MSKNYTIVGGGWKDKSKKGDQYLRVKFKTTIPEGAIVMMYKNKKKFIENSPDYLFWACLSDDGDVPNESFLF